MKKLKLIVIVVVVTVVVIIALLYWIGSKEEKSPTSNTSNNNVNLSNSSANTHTSNTSVKFPKTYNEDEFGFKVSYPADWTYTQPDAHTVVFSGKEGTDAYYSTVNVQNISSKKAGGNYATTNEMVAALKDQFLAQPQGEILEQGNSTLTQTDGTEYEGKYLIVTYQYQNELTKQEQRVYPRKDGLGFYAWAYTSPEDLYDDYYPIAKSILEEIEFSK